MIVMLVAAEMNGLSVVAVAAKAVAAVAVAVAFHVEEEPRIRTYCGCGGTTSYQGHTVEDPSKKSHDSVQNQHLQKQRKSYHQQKIRILQNT